MASKPKLKPCPFCGGEAYEFVDRSLSLESGEWCARSFVCCNGCSALVSGATQEEAETQWNRRVNETEVRDGE